MHKCTGIKKIIIWQMMKIIMKKYKKMESICKLEGIKFLNNKFSSNKRLSIMKENNRKKFNNTDKQNIIVKKMDLKLKRENMRWKKEKMK